MNGKPTSESHDESRLGVLLRALDRDAATPDAARLASLRQQSLEAFQAEAKQAGGLVYQKGRSPMVTLAVRSLVALAAAVLAGVVWLSPWSETPVRGAPFAKVLEQLREAESLRLQIKREGSQAQVWIRRPGLVRWEESPEVYQIAVGSRWWKVDESNNTVSTGDSPWFTSAEQQVDLLALLDLGLKDARPLLRSRPTDKATYDGHEYVVYRSSLKGKQGWIEVEALADAQTGQLAAILARPPPKSPGDIPLAELRLIAVNEPIDESKFVVAKTLTEDGRIGKVSDAQGVVGLRPMLAKRWTPVFREVPLKPGDWLRTELRGANAVKATMSSNVEVTLGPGSLLECISPTEARLHSGTAQVHVPSKETSSFTLLAPRKGSEKIDEGKTIYRVDREEQLVALKDTPLWLSGFEGTTNNESLGSLIVNLPDGRNEPLTVGYHKVSVEIRDQIARTTIEESFVNHTGGRLEGIFHFPLPSDASISGFGMWIGNDLIEADIVEKQRAREIYETILREKRDPGLLEWTAGNLFKARVFPIEPHSEKRIKIVYTQVLPLRGNKYRYSYSLRSDLLQTKPLRELSLSVLVNSALPLKSVSCPTHSARTQQAAHSAQVEFAAQEHTPTRDFEVVCEIDAQQSDVVVVPHRRGDDGYFLLQLMPPGGEGELQREVLPDGKPLNVVLLCDTSASMDAEKRRQQAEFVASVLASLTDSDRFHLAASDVGTAWAFDESVAATDDNVAKAKAFLEDRLSLGWTNLERAFTDVLKRSAAGSHVIYVGDGIVSAGETDPAAFVKRLALLLGEQGESKRTFHAVTVGNVYESVVLQGIAGQSGGSVRSVTGEQTPQAIAAELLRELTQPGLTDLNLEFRGVQVAAVYPGELPNLAAGTQQILVGRYLPQGADQQGEVIVTGRRGKETVRYVARIALKDAEKGNSFIPRLWARAHLDHLLQQGQSEAVRSNIIALSEEFHLITPYTSLLVLETDADRERFGVKRRYEMRDGEQFFAAGRDNARYELLQQQMKRAGDWRIALRRQVLAELAILGRNPQQFQQQTRHLERLGRILNEPYGSASSIREKKQLWYDGAPAGGMPGGFGGGEFAGDDLAFLSLGQLFETDKLHKSLEDFRSISSRGGDVAARLDDEEEFALGFGESDRRDKSKELIEDLSLAYDTGIHAVADSLMPMEPGMPDAPGAPFSKLNGLKAELFDPFPASGPMPAFKPGSFGGFAGRSHQYYHHIDYTSWLSTLFPHLAPPGKPVEPKDPEKWSPEAIALSKTLLRTEWLHKLEGGVEIRRTVDTFNVRWQRRESHNADLALYSPKAWLTRTLDAEDHTIIEFCNEKERGAYSRALLLGRTRPANEHDLKSPPLPLEYFTLTPLHHSQSYYEARVEAAGENQVKLILTSTDASSQLTYLIDTARNVVLKLEQTRDGKRSSSTTYSDFVQVASAWFATRQIIHDEQDRKVGETTFEFKSLAAADSQKRLDQELAAKSKALFLGEPLPKLSVARQKTADGSADVSDHIVMILLNAQLQQWDEVLKQVDAIEKLAAEKPGARWLRTILLITMRRNDEARQRLLDEARKLAGGKSADEIYLADFVLARAASVASGSEMQEFVELLKPVYERQPAELNVMPRWHNYQLSAFDSLGRHEEALALRKQLTEASPWEVNQHTDYVRRLVNAGRLEAAIAWLQQQIAREDKWTDMEDNTLRNTLADMHRSHARWQELLAFTTEWIGRNPEDTSAYQQHLSALVYNDKLADANQLVEQWLRGAQVERKHTTAERLRLRAAIYFAQGNAHNLSFYRMDPRWPPILAEAAKFFVQHKEHLSVVQEIFDHRLAETDSGDQLRGHLLKLLQDRAADLSSEQVNYLVGTTLGGRIALAAPIEGRKELHASELPESVWKPIAATLRQRWSKAVDKDDRHRLGESLKSIYAHRFADSEYLPFLRERIKSAPPEYKITYLSELFEAILSRPWTNDLEGEAFQLLRQLAHANSEVDKLVVQVPALYRLVDAMIHGRTVAEETQLKDQGKLVKLTRMELAKKKSEIRKAAMTGVADRLAAEAKQVQSPLKAWLEIEQSWLDVRLDRKLAQVEQRCWQILGETPPKPETEEELEQFTPAEHQQRFFAAVLRHRAFTTVMNLAARRSAAESTIARGLKYIEAGIDAKSEAAAAWRMAKFRLLVALDRADDLERSLRDWIRTDVSTAPWRVMLGILVAERGKIEEAIRLFQAAEKDKLLTATHYRMLADWYLVSDRREAYERSRIEAFKQLPEQYIAGFAYRMRDRWYNRDLPLPSELDEDTLLAFRALFEKSAHPESYLYRLRDLYAACRDFRLLQILPDAVLGRSPQQIYAFLNAVESQVLVEMRNEATADEILARIEQLRQGERTSTDQRALDLLEALVERKSSEVLNQPGPHVIACVAALKRGFEREWGEGEPRLMSGFLHNLGTLRHPAMVEEQLHEMRELRQMTNPGTRDHLLITNDLANVLFWSYHKPDEAIPLMENEVQAYLAANDGRWPYVDIEILGSYVRLLEGADRHAAGEAALLAELARAENDEHRKWLEQRLFSLYNHAIEHKGAVSLGSGDAMFVRVVDRGVKLIEDSSDDNHRYQLVTRLVAIFDTARRNKLASQPAKLRTFAFETMPQILKRQLGNYRNTATSPIGVVKESLGAKAAVQYIVERMEQYPQRLDITWESAWDAFGYELAMRREEAVEQKADMTALNPRILEITIAELKRHLRSGQSRSQYLYHDNYGHFWKEKTADFARAADEVYAEHKTSGRRIAYIASYLWHGLDRRTRAIEMLLVANSAGLLDESSQEQLVEFLHHDKRYAESIPILEGLIKLRPDTINHRVRLMTAYYHTQRAEQLAELLKATEAHFRQEGRWTPSNAAQLAGACLGCQLNEKAVELFKEAIAQHQRDHGGITVGDATLSSWYQQLAQAHSNLGQTIEAVDAASAAIVCWGAHHTQRRFALDALRNVLSAAKDLDAYVKHLDAEAAKTGQDSPILRKSIGQVYHSRGKHEAAVSQFRLSLAMQPMDKEVHAALITSLDALGRKDEATRQLLAQIDADRHNLALYQTLADRMKDDEAQAQRAATSIIEAAPSEAENHAAYAELLQKHNRWHDAIPHWQQVAELRRLEPTGLLKLAEAQIHEKQWAAAQETVTKLQRTEWPARFNDVQQQTRNLQEKLPK